jgi:hypothetical protein
MKSATKKEKLAGGFAAMFTPSARGDGFIDNAAGMPRKKARKAAATQEGGSGKPRKAIGPTSGPAIPPPIPPPAPEPGAAFGGKLVAAFKWQDGQKASAARPCDCPEDEPAPITYKGATGRLPFLLPDATRPAFLAHCAEAAEQSGAALHYINAKGGRARKHDREGKRPSEIGIADGWQRYSVTIRKAHHAELERMREASGLSHKEIIDAALARELARMRAEIEGNTKKKGTAKP